MNERGELCSALDPNGIVNGDLCHESSKVDLKHGEAIQSKDNGNQKRSNDVDSLESEDSGLSDSKFSSYTAADRYKASRRSHSRGRYNDGVHGEGRSHVGDSVRHRSRSQSILAEDEDARSKSRRQHGVDSSCYDGKHKNDYELDDPRRSLPHEDRRHESRDALRDEKRERSSRYSRYDREESRHHSRERDVENMRRREEKKRRIDELDRDHKKKNERDRSMDREWERDRKRERRDSSVDKVNDRNRKRDLETERSRDIADGSRTDKERDRMISESRRERERDRSRDRTRDIERGKYSEREINDRKRNMEDERKLEKGSSDDRNSHRHRVAENVEGKYDKYGYEDRSKRSKNSRHDTLYHRDGTREDNSVKVLEGGTDYQKRFFSIQISNFSPPDVAFPCGPLTHHSF